MGPGGPLQIQLRTPQVRALSFLILPNTPLTPYLSVNRGHLSPPKEACDHAFSYKTANWGWAQFAKRDTAFYNSNIVRHVDAFLIICNITSSPTVPSPGALVLMKAVPRSLMHAVGGMLDDPVYSDVEFLLPARRRGREGRSIFAAKRILQRVEYFELSELIISLPGISISSRRG